MGEIFASPHSVAVGGGETKEDILFKSSSLSDEAFFYHYAQTFNRQKVNKNEPFPLKLYRIIYEAEKNGQDDIISFCPSGRSFMIHNVDEFGEKIMPQYFTSNRMASFQRQLNLYGFRRRLRGNDKGGFWHESFILGQRNICLTIKRKVQTFKVPPHLLTDEPSPTPAVVTPTSPKSSETRVSHLMMQAPSPTWCEANILSPVNPSSKKTGGFEGSPSVENSIVSNNDMLPHIPMLGLGGLSNDVAFFSRNLVGQAPSLKTIELLRLNQRIQIAKEMAAMKHQVALAAFHRLVNRVDL
jgi:HSF-type DNA-binding